MSVEVLILAMASAVRPSTSTAAIYALLSSERPRPALAAFTIAGLAFSCAFGLVVVSALHGVSLPGRESTRNAIIDLVAGAAMIGFAAGAWSGHVDRLRRRRAAAGPGRIVTMLRRPTLKVAAVAGAATHLPGLFYLVALNAIAGGSPPLAEAILAVLVYNAIWFAVPIAAVVVAGRRAARAHERIEQINAWLRAREQVIVVVLFAAVGAYLVIKGILELTS
jgi:Sap, sulfolipid-1-addressing protein